VASVKHSEMLHLIGRDPDPYISELLYLRRPERIPSDPGETGGQEIVLAKCR
jgi:hypothetical protein